MWLELSQFDIILYIYILDEILQRDYYINIGVYNLNACMFKREKEKKERRIL